MLRNELTSLYVFYASVSLCSEVRVYLEGPLLNNCKLSFNVFHPLGNLELFKGRQIFEVPSQNGGLSRRDGAALLL